MFLQLFLLTIGILNILKIVLPIIERIESEYLQKVIVGILCGLIYWTYMYFIQNNNHKSDNFKELDHFIKYWCKNILHNLNELLKYDLGIYKNIELEYKLIKDSDKIKLF